MYRYIMLTLVLTSCLAGCATLAKVNQATIPAPTQTAKAERITLTKAARQIFESSVSVDCTFKAGSNIKLYWNTFDLLLNNVARRTIPGEIFTGFEVYTQKTGDGLIIEKILRATSHKDGKSYVFNLLSVSRPENCR